MSAIIERFPGIKKAALEIAYDNGMINRHCAEVDWLQSLDPVLGAGGVVEEDLARLDTWLLSLGETDLLTLCAGESEEMAAVSERGPRGGPDGAPLSDLLNDIFEAPR